MKSVVLAASLCCGTSYATAIRTKEHTLTDIHKLKILLIIGVVEIVALASLKNVQDGSVNFMGYQAFAVGNRKVLVKPPQGRILITDADQIKRRLHTQKILAFALVGDSSNTGAPPVLCDYLQAGEYDEIPKLLTALEQDTSATLVRKNSSTEELTLIHKVQVSDSVYSFVLSRYSKCYPYYFRVRAVWAGSEAIPTSVTEALSSIEVRK